MQNRNNPSDSNLFYYLVIIFFAVIASVYFYLTKSAKAPRQANAKEKLIQKINKEKLKDKKTKNESAALKGKPKSSKNTNISIAKQTSVNIDKEKIPLTINVTKKKEPSNEQLARNENQPLLVNKKEKKDSKTLEIKFKIEEKNRLKLKIKLEQTEKERLEKEKKEQEKRERQERKEQEKLERRNLQKMNSANDLVISKPTTEIVVPQQTNNECKSTLSMRKMLSHAKFLIKFEYSETNADRNIETLAFLYHFHRYNLCRRVLAKDVPEKSLSVALRTWFVHMCNKVDINENLILETRDNLRGMIDKDIEKIFGELDPIQEDNDLRNLRLFCEKNGNKEQPMASLSALRLVLLLSQNEMVDSYVGSPFQLHQWMKNTIVPILNAVHDSNHKNMNDALKMIIIIFGDYCSETKVKNSGLNNYFHLFYQKNNAAEMTEFMSLFRKIRNDLSHHLALINMQSDLENLLNKASELNPNVADLDGLLTKLNPVNVQSYQKPVYQDNKFRVSFPGHHDSNSKSL